jgi:hypothetical protein
MGGMEAEYNLLIQSEATDNNTDVCLLLITKCTLLYMGGPLMVAQWLRYCATNRKVGGSIPDGVIGIFH